MNRVARWTAALLLIASGLFAQEPAEPIRIAAEPLGDAAAGIASRVTFRMAIPGEVPPGAPLVLQGSVSSGGSVTKTFRYVLPEERREVFTTVMQLPEGEIEIEARLMIDVPDSTPVIVAKKSVKLTIVKTGKVFVANEADGAEAIVAEGVAETQGAVRIRTPKRDVAPNLFIVEVDVKSPVTRVEFWVEGKKIVVRNAPPYRAEVDLGAIPKRVEVRAIGYDRSGRYVDADAFVVNERDTQLEVKITRTVGKDGINHIKLSVQNPEGREIRKVELYAGKKLIHEWKAAPYAVSIPQAQLGDAEFLRASVVDETNYEAADLMFLSGDRFTESIEVSVVELPVSVTDEAGAPIPNLTADDFSILEDGKPQKVATFNYASKLPIAVGILMDRSGSMKPRMDDAKAAASSFLTSTIKPGDRAFVGAFAFDSTDVAPFVTEPSMLKQQVEAIGIAEGGTSLYDAIVTGLYRFRNMQGRKALILITDGEDTTSRLPYDEMLTYARAARVPLYFIGIGMGLSDRSGTSKMKTLAAETGGNAYFIRNVKQLPETYKQLESDLRSQYLLTYNAETSKKDTKYRAVEVKVNRPDAHVRTIRGYIP
jgi:VWFA-related protein